MSHEIFFGAKIFLRVVEQQHHDRAPFLMIIISSHATKYREELLLFASCGLMCVCECEERALLPCFVLCVVFSR